MAAFYASIDTWITQIVNDLVEQVLEPLVMLNWRRAEEFQVMRKPLAESFHIAEQLVSASAAAKCGLGAPRPAVSIKLKGRVIVFACLELSILPRDIPRGK